MTEERDGVAERVGVPAADLSDGDLMRELEQLHRTRHDTLLHAPTQALQHHSERTAELELEYLRRRPERDIDQARLRGDAPAAARSGTGSAPDWSQPPLST